MKIPMSCNSCLREFQIISLRLIIIITAISLCGLTLFEPCANAQDFDGLIDEMHEQQNYWTPQQQRNACMGGYYAAMRANAAQHNNVNRTVITPQQQSVTLGSTGQTALDRGDFLSAIDYFSQALRLDPNNASARRKLAFAQDSQACALYANQDYQGALSYYQQALATNPGDPIIQRNVNLTESMINAIAARRAARLADQQAAGRMRNLLQQNGGDNWFVPADGAESDLSPQSDPMLWGSDVVDLRGSSTDVVNIGVAQAINPTISPSLNELKSANVAQASPMGQLRPTPVLFDPPATQQQAQAMVKKLDSQIDTIKKQLSTLGFSVRSDDFEEITAMSMEARDELVSRLSDQVSELVTDAIADQGKDLLRTGIEGDTGVAAEKVIKDLQDAGFPPDAVEQAVLNDISDTADRINLADTVEGGINAHDKLQTVNEVSQLYNENTVESRQDALLKTLSIVDEAKPAVQVAQAAYAVGDAGFCLMVLSGGQRQLDAQTNQQLADLKSISNHMKSLVTQRNAVRNMMSKLPK